MSCWGSGHCGKGGAVCGAQQALGSACPVGAQRPVHLQRRLAWPGGPSPRPRPSMEPGAQEVLVPGTRCPRRWTETGSLGRGGRLWAQLQGRRAGGRGQTRSHSEEPRRSRPQTLIEALRPPAQRLCHETPGPGAALDTRMRGQQSCWCVQGRERPDPDREARRGEGMPPGLPQLPTPHGPREEARVASACQGPFQAGHRAQGFPAALPVP